MFLILKKRLLLTLATVILLLCIMAGATAAILAARPEPLITVVLDAGHGGVDRGVVGAGGTTEAEMNLKITLEVAEYLKGVGYNVVLTRETKDGLYGELTDGFKMRDMKKRKEIINNATPDVVVSIHCNKFPSSSRRGAQTFFEPLSEESKSLAHILQSSLNSLNRRELNKAYSELSGDYYVLKCSPYPSTIVECGFLSNAEDEALLNDENYRKEVSYAIFSGIVTYLTKGN